MANGQIYSNNGSLKSGILTSSASWNKISRAFPFKMDDGLLSLKWNNHKTTFFEILKVLRDKANYTDATLAVEGNFYPVHKLVLSTCSEYFNEIFERTPCKSPVIVLKDVRSQDLESLLDYMYLGEVNVNQNDLALLLKTAECLRIKGLAVPDEDPTRHSTPTSHHHHKPHTLSAEDLTHDTPPPKRRKEDSSSAASPHISPAARVPSSPTQPLATDTPTTTLSSTSQAPSIKTSSTNVSSSSHDHDAPLVKVEMEESEGEDAFHGEDNYEAGGATADEGREFVEKAEHDPSTYPNTNFSVGSSQQQAGDLPWEDGENSFPPEAFGGDSSSQQAGGDDEDEDVDVTSLRDEDDLETGTLNQHNSFLSLSLIQSKEARRCQLCQVTLANANLLRRHVEDHHFHIRKYDCVHCGKKFKRKEHRERHERIHTGEKPFACHICCSRFTQKEHLKGHVENVHHKHMRDKDPPADVKDQENEREGSASSPPSLASPSSISSLMSSSLSNMFPGSLPLSHLSHILPRVPSPTAILPTTTSEENANSLMALYAPVTRKTVESPNKHVQTITINFN